MADRLGAMRGPGESYSDVILRIAAQKQEATDDGDGDLDVAGRQRRLRQRYGFRILSENRLLVCDVGRRRAGAGQAARAVEKAVRR
jgi:hypothetical protein